jgi:hypothetical protein
MTAPLRHRVSFIARGDADTDATVLLLPGNAAAALASKQIVKSDDWQASGRPPASLSLSNPHRTVRLACAIA